MIHPDLWPWLMLLAGLGLAFLLAAGIEHLAEQTRDENTR